MNAIDLLLVMSQVSILQGREGPPGQRGLKGDQVEHSQIILLFFAIILLFCFSLNHDNYYYCFDR